MERKKLKTEEPGRKSGEEEPNGLEPNEEKDGEKEECETGGRGGQQTCYYCKTCAGEPSLCPVPCFEVYHTRLIYTTAPDLDPRGRSPHDHHTVTPALAACSPLRSPPPRTTFPITPLVSLIQLRSDVALSSLVKLLLVKRGRVSCTPVCLQPADPATAGLSGT